MIYLFSLNELVLPRFLVLTLLGRKVKVLRIAPFVAKLHEPFKRLVNWAINSGRAEYAVKLIPELQNHWDFERRFYFQEEFKKYEPWQNAYYGFDRPGISEDPVYGLAFKQITCTYTFRKVIETFLLDAIEKKYSENEFRIYGVLQDTIALGQNRTGTDAPTSTNPLRVPRQIINSVMIILASMYALATLIVRIRPYVKQDKVDVAFDMMGDNREFELFREIADAGRFLLVRRFPNATGAAIPDELNSVTCSRSDGLFSIASALRGASMILGHILMLSRRHWNEPPALFYEMLSLPLKRILIRGLIERYKPDNYIGRDEYNPDHILRRAELRRMGIKSIGISNALFPCFSLLAPNVRYVSFDTYYVYAAPLFSQYRDTWAAGMEVKTLGGYSIAREHLTSFLGGRGEDILFTMRVAWDQPEMVCMVRAVCKAFPERIVYLQFKKGFVSEAETDRLITACGEGLANFRHTTDDVYSLLKTAKYHISDISTFVAEAIRSGMVTLVADLIDMEFNCFRLFPDLCLKNSEDLVAKLHKLESGDISYPHQEYFKLLGYKHGDVGFDLLRHEIGLNN